MVAACIAGMAPVDMVEGKEAAVAAAVIVVDFVLSDSQSDGHYEMVRRLVLGLGRRQESGLWQSWLRASSRVFELGPPAPFFSVVHHCYCRNQRWH